MRRILAISALAAAATLLVCPQPGALADDPPEQFVLTPTKEAAWGEHQLASFLGSRVVSNDRAMIERFGRIGSVVADVSDRSGIVYTFLVVEGHDIQAFAFPGGTVCFTESMVRLFERDDELAFVIGHELSHVALRHHVSKVRFESALATLPRSYDRDAAPMRSFYDRNAEVEADAFGALYATRAGYAYSASIEALEILAGSGIAQEDAGHPAFATRIETLQSVRSELRRAIELFDAGTDALQAGHVDDAIEALKLFVATFPNSAGGRTNLGAAYLARARTGAGSPGDLAEVLPVVRDSGVVLRTGGEYDPLDLPRAASHFEHALRYHPDGEEPRAGLALVYARQERYDDGRELLEDLLVHLPDSILALLSLGNLEYLAGDPVSAETHYRRALSLDPDRSEVRRNLAVVCEKNGRTDEALDLWLGLTEDDVYGSEARLHVVAAGAD